MLTSRMLGSNLALAPQSARKMRMPRHPFYIKHAPFEIQPFFIAPVLPGETMKNLRFQARVLTSPIKSKLIGWWCEHYFFYCKHRDLADSDTFQTLMLDSTADLTGAADYRTSAANAFTGWTGTGTGMDWLQACIKAIIPAYFRDQGGAWNECTIDGNPASYVYPPGTDTWLQSAVLDTGMAAVDVTIPVNATPDPDVVNVSDVLSSIRQYEMLRAQGLVEMTYEDYLRSYGVRVERPVENTPELVRYSRVWAYPSATVAPSTTTAGDAEVSSAVSWSIAERADKDRFFREPGFLVGLTVVRPKVYLSTIKRPAVSLMDDLYSWLPAMLAMDSEASFKMVTDAATDILGGGASGNWWIDLKDLFLHGDQFTNQTDLSSANGMALPDASLGTKAPVQASVDAMFVSADATGGVLQDGIVNMAILGQQVDTSPRGSAMRVR